MKRLLITAAAVLTLLMSGCAIHYQGNHCRDCGSGGAKGDPANPKVSVVDGAIQVDQNVLRFSRDQTDFIVTWRLPKDSKLSFPDNGVVFERLADGEIVDCRRSPSGTEFTCLNRNTKPGTYKYGVNVNEGGRPLKPLDPHLVNGGKVQ